MKIFSLLFCTAFLFFSVTVVAQSDGFKESKSFYHGNSPSPDITLPSTFPDITIDLMNNPAPGNYFVGPFGMWGMFSEATPYITIIDNYAHPIFFQKMPFSNINDFKMHPGGQISFSGGRGNFSYIMNENMVIIDSIQPNPYWIDFHEILLMPDNTKWVLGIDTRIVDMDTVVPGGQPQATVMGHVVQQMDNNNNVIFEWNTWDHYKLTDCEDYYNLTTSLIDYAHVNTIEIDSDTSLLILPRNMNEITKIDRRSGDIIWRMGGKHNEFTFTNDDTLGWGWPHDIRKIGDGLFSLFDNGRFNTPSPHYSSGVILQIDELNKTITEISRFTNQPDVLGEVMGNFQLLPNGNFVTGWGSGFFPNLTEFNPDGTPALQMSMNSISYRIYKFNWQPRLFYPENDTMDFGLLTTETYELQDLTLFNNADYAVTLTGCHFRFGNFFCDNTFPVIMPANGSVNLKIRFQPDEAGVFEDALTIHADNADTTIRVGRQVYLKAEAQEGFSIGENSLLSIKVSPNPVHESAAISFGKSATGVVNVIDLMGNTVNSLSFGNKQSVNINFAKFKSGIYFLEIVTENKERTFTKIMKY